MSLGSGLLAAVVAKKGLDGTWRAATGKDPPANPADPDVDIWEAVLWAAVSGTAIGVARMLAERRAARTTTRSPPVTCRPSSSRKDDQAAAPGAPPRPA